ncbi:MAG: YafY family protein [Betaproteobacteria bacterium]
MARSARLLDLLQSLRRRRTPATAAALAAELGVSERTIYRDIATLCSHGASIDGAAGIGYVLRPGFVLPPLMFSDDEIEALVLGLRWVSQRGDDALRAAAADAHAKIAAVLPAPLREKTRDAYLLVGGESRPAVAAPVAPPQASVALSVLRAAIRGERRLAIEYLDMRGKVSERTIWPFALAFFEHARIVAAWCETRQDYRHFRTDRIVRAHSGDDRYPRPRRSLLAEWRKRESIPEQL